MKSSRKTLVLASILVPVVLIAGAAFFRQGDVSAETQVLLNRVLRLSYSPAPEDLWSAIEFLADQGQTSELIKPEAGKRLVIKGAVLGVKAEGGADLTFYGGPDQNNLRGIFINFFESSNPSTTHEIHFDDGLPLKKGESLFVRLHNSGVGVRLNFWGYSTDAKDEVSK